MKTKRNMSAIALLTVLLFSAGTAYAQNAGEKNKGGSTDYNVMSRLNESPKPAGFTPQLPKDVKESFNENVITVSARVLNEDSKMLKVGKVQTVGQEGSGAWQMMCDEGGATYEQTALNPLSYMLGGISSSLLTHVEQFIELMGLDVKDVKVEARVFFRYDDPLTKKWSGYADSVVANIIIESDESEAQILELQKMALQAWAIGECLENPTTVNAEFEFNGEIWDTEYGSPGKVVGPDSYDNNLKLTSKVGKLVPKSLKLGKDVPMHLTNPYKFEVVGIAESANDVERPYLHKIHVRSLNDNYATWEIYADDSRGYEGVEKAPSSREYFSIGTTLCLMSQFTASEMFYKIKRLTKIPDYRAEHQFYFQEDNAMTMDAIGHVDSVTTRILVNSKTSEKKMEAFANQSLRMCFAGDAVSKATPMKTGIYLNGKLVK